MAAKRFQHEIGSRRTRTLGTVATLIGVYTAFYLAVIGVVHFMSSPDAAAAMTPDTTVQQAAAPNVPPETSGTLGGLPALRDANPAPTATDNSRECAGDANVKTDCIYN